MAEVNFNPNIQPRRDSEDEREKERVQKKQDATRQDRAAAFQRKLQAKDAAPKKPAQQQVGTQAQAQDKATKEQKKQFALPADQQAKAGPQQTKQTMAGAQSAQPQQARSQQLQNQQQQQQAAISSWQQVQSEYAIFQNQQASQHQSNQGQTGGQGQYQNQNTKGADSSQSARQASELSGRESSKLTTDGPQRKQDTAQAKGEPTAVQAQAAAQQAPQQAPVQPKAYATFNPGVIQQMVQYAALGRTPDGLSQFHIGFQSGPLAGVRVAMTALGSRRVKMSFSGVSDSDTVSENDILPLLDALRKRNIDVAEVEMI